MQNHSRTTAIAVTMLFIAACDSVPTTSAESGGRPSLGVQDRYTPSRYGSINADESTVLLVDSLARWMAMQLADPLVRTRLVESLRASTGDDEHKLLLGQSKVGMISGADVARAVPVPPIESGAPRSFDNLDVALEVYMPVRAHRDRYAGDEPLLVAWQLFEDSAPVAYDRGGRRLVLDLERPPREAVLALVPRESALQQVTLDPRCKNTVEAAGAIGTWSCAQASINVSSAESPDISAMIACDPMTAIIPCDDGPGPGGAPPLPGFYLTDAHLDDMREPWILGTPEITYHITTLPTFGNSFDTRVSCLSDSPLPSGQFFLDHNSNTQSFAIGGTHMYLSQPQIADMEAIAAVRGLPHAEVRVTVWEDDSGSKCTLDKTNVLSDLQASVGAIQGLVGIFKGFNKCVNTAVNPQDSTLITIANRRFRALSNLCGLLRVAGLVSSALQLFNGDDDFIGVAEAVPDPSLNGGWSHVIVGPAGQQQGRFNITGVDLP